MANKKDAPNATYFLVFPMRVKAAAMIHKKTIAAAATAAPTEKTSFTSVKTPNKNRYGKIKKLSDSRLATSPIFPNTMLGKDMSQTKTMEQTGMSDHVKLSVIAKLQMRHTMIPIISIAENKIEKITFFAMVFCLPPSRFHTSIFSCSPVSLGIFLYDLLGSRY